MEMMGGFTEIKAVNQTANKYVYFNGSIENDVTHFYIEFVRLGGNASCNAVRSGVVLSSCLSVHPSVRPWTSPSLSSTTCACNLRHWLPATSPDLQLCVVTTGR